MSKILAACFVAAIAFAAVPALARHRPVHQQVHNLYYDTSDQALRRQRAAQQPVVGAGGGGFDPRQAGQAAPVLPQHLRAGIGDDQMEGVVDHLMRDMLTRIGGYDLCITEFIRIVDQKLPARVFTRFCPELQN